MAILCLRVLLVTLAVILFSSCRRPPETHRVVISESPVTVDPTLRMRATIQRRVFYDYIPSASGLEMVGNFLYVIGDDSPFLYKLDRDFRLVDRIALDDTSSFRRGRVAKAEKLDLEGMTSFTLRRKEYLLMLGSGSGPMRNNAYLAEMPASGGGNPVISVHSLDSIYAHLQQDRDIVGDGLLNIEGVAVGNGRLFLMQRAISEGNNVLLSYDLDEFIHYLTYVPPGPSSASPQDTAIDSLVIIDTEPAVPLPVKYYFSLPILGELQAGFSGAYFYDNKIFFTASIEKTSDAVQDGQVFGSYVGYIPLDALPADENEVISVPAAVITRPDGATYIGKVESLVVLERVSGRRYRVLAVSDDDKGNSEMMELVLRSR